MLPLSSNPTLVLAWVPGPMELIVVAIVVLLLFGSRVPTLMRSLGSSISEFKKGTREAELEDQRPTPTEESPRRS